MFPRHSRYSGTLLQGGRHCSYFLSSLYGTYPDTYFSAFNLSSLKEVDVAFGNSSLIGMLAK